MVRKFFINIFPLIEGTPHVTIILFQIAVYRKKCYKPFAHRWEPCLEMRSRRALVRVIIYHEKVRLEKKFKYHMEYIQFS